MDTRYAKLCEAMQALVDAACMDDDAKPIDVALNSAMAAVIRAKVAHRQTYWTEPCTFSDAHDREFSDALEAGARKDAHQE